MGKGNKSLKELLDLVFIILGGIGTVFFLLCAIAFMPSVASVLSLITAVICLPIKPIRNMWNMIPIKKAIAKPLSIVVLFFAVVFSAPKAETTPLPETQVVQEIEEAAETAEVVAVETEAKNIPKTEATPEKEIKEETEEAKKTSASTTVTPTDKTAEKETTAPKKAEPSKTEVAEEVKETALAEPVVPKAHAFSISSVPAYAGKAYVKVNDNTPFFAEEELSPVSFESYASLDSKGRCGICVANVGTDIMPTEERGEIGSVKPSGWNQAKYAGLVDGNYLYNRCHLIGYQLTGENANTKNLITGTRYLNIEGMLPFENMVADYIKETKNHVLYRVTPVFEGNNLLASGVLMEAKSVEDDGDGIEYCVYCYNVQPGVVIDYSNGSSRLAQEATTTESKETTQKETTPVVQEPSTPQEEKIQQTPSEPVIQQPAQPVGGAYAVNAKNGKIHIVGGCSATGTGDNAMTSPVYFATYEEAEAYSIQIAPGQNKRPCGNCW